MSAVETITPEVVAAPAPATEQLLAVAAQSGLPAETAQTLQAAFLPAFAEARTIIEKSRGIVVTDVSQVLDIKVARTYRLALRSVRTGADKLRKELKEDGLRRGKAIDGFYNILVHMLDGEETRLHEQEQFAERAEAARRATLEVERTKELATYGVTLVGLGAMADETYAQLLFNAKVGHEAKLEAARKAEAERIAAENARLVEEARIRAENERLKREADEREAAAKIEREAAAQKQREADAAIAAERAKAQAEAAAAAEAARVEKERVEALAAEEKRKAAAAAKLAAAKAKAERDAIEAKAKAEREAAEAAARAERERLQALAEIERQKAETARLAAEAKAKEEREAREKVEAELRAAKEAEAKRLAEEAEAQRQAALAPDKEKLLGLAIQLRATEIPALSTPDGRAVTALLVTKLDKLAAWLEQEASVL